MVIPAVVGLASDVQGAAEQKRWAREDDATKKRDERSMVHGDALLTS